MSEPEEKGVGGRALAVALVTATAAIVASVFFLFRGAGTYAKPVDEIANGRTALLGRPLRAVGILVHGSLARRESPCEYRFTIHGADHELPVHFAGCVVPDNLRDVDSEALGLTVEGHLMADDTFEATQILTQCPSKYLEAERASPWKKSAPRPALPDRL
jgi:cytochrome c-type biogenesis protein CcmE